MGVLSDLEPKSVFRYFEEITKIPHGSGNVQQISDYLVDFAKERGLFYIQDELKNVIIIKEATPGYEKEPTVILQGHMDMVAVKKPDCEIDMKTEGLRVAVRGDEIYAEGTSLGGDDGIAVAYSLALLDSETIKHPRLEIVITVDEEVGMDGARGIDLSALTGNRLINLDSEEEGIFLASCAGGARVSCVVPMSVTEREGILLECECSLPKREGTLPECECSLPKREGTLPECECSLPKREGVLPECECILLELEVGGLLGGHSGAEIHKERGNSNCLMGRVLNRLLNERPVYLCGLDGGLADNAIPRETRALILADEKDCEALSETVKAVEAELKAEFATKDPEVYVSIKNKGIENKGMGNCCCAGLDDTRRAAEFLCALPNGVQGMSADMPGLVETSLNLGILEFCREDGRLTADFSVRSSVESAKQALIERLAAVTHLAGGSCTVSGDYPGWKYRKDSPLREKMVAVYEKMYGVTPKVEAIHAGLECGILGSKIEDLDCVSIGPKMRDIHTTEETLSISSTRRVWEYLVRFLEEKEL